ncbi:MAG TPA: hypothetical protein VE843_04360, partial [Ktedonobacteraceae bacterium]|nr:hypothetical protein [Ktedonobacteraceae bacterium]
MWRTVPSGKTCQGRGALHLGNTPSRKDGLVQVAESAHQPTRHSRRARITDRVVTLVFFLCTLLL